MGKEIEAKIRQRLVPIRRTLQLLLLGKKVKKKSLKISLKSVDTIVDLISDSCEEMNATELAKAKEKLLLPKELSLKIKKQLTAEKYTIVLSRVVRGKSKVLMIAHHISNFDLARTLVKASASFLLKDRNKAKKLIEYFDRMKL